MFTTKVEVPKIGAKNIHIEHGGQSRYGNTYRTAHEMAYQGVKNNVHKPEQKI